MYIPQFNKGVKVTNSYLQDITSATSLKYSHFLLINYTALLFLIELSIFYHKYV